MTAEELPQPTTNLEDAMLRVLRAWLSGIFWGASGWEMMWILQASVENRPYLVSSNSKLYRETLYKDRRGPEVYALLQPFIRLSRAAETRLLEEFARKRAQDTKRNDRPDRQARGDELSDTVYAPAGVQTNP